jgi:peptidoglycan/xylan/chitin deacetylase (PgdA/CDA1 family)
LIRAAKHLAPNQRAKWVGALCDAVDAQLPDDLMMTDSQVRTLAEAGMEIGAHTLTHPILRILEAEEALHEIRTGREMLQAITGREIRAFAYPNGRPGEDYTDRDRNIVASLGFDFAVSTCRGAATTRSDYFQLPRFTPWDRHPARWLTRLLTAAPAPLA